MGGGRSKSKLGSGWQKAGAFLVAASAALLPLFLIVQSLKGLDLVEQPRLRVADLQNYSAAIDHLSGTSETLITITLAILGAGAIWALKGRKIGLFGYIIAYAVFVGCVISIYFGIKLGYSAGLTLSGTAPDIEPLLSLLSKQALAALLSGLLLTGLVVFFFMMSDEP